MPEGVRYLSKELSPLSPADSAEKQIQDLHRQVSDRFKQMYVEEGAGSGTGGDELAVSGAAALVHIILSKDELVSIDWLVGLGHSVAEGNSAMYIAWEQDATGGHLVAFEDNEFHGVGKFGATSEWTITTAPSRITVTIFVRNPSDANKWYLVSMLKTIPAPDRSA